MQLHTSNKRQAGLVFISPASFASTWSGGQDLWLRPVGIAPLNELRNVLDANSALPLAGGPYGFTHLDLVTRGTGRVVAIGENKSVQAPESGTIVSFNVKKGQKVSANQLLATISRTEAIGVLEEYETRLENLNIQLIRVDAELAKSSIRYLSNTLINFS